MDLSKIPDDELEKECRRRGWMVQSCGYYDDSDYYRDDEDE